MAKNLMTGVATLLGVEIGEEFIIENADRKETVVLAMDGLHVIQPNGVLGSDHGKLLSKVLQGLYEVKKIPWEPKNKDVYWSIIFQSDGKPVLDWSVWRGVAVDYYRKALGMVYRTEAEAEANLSKDYERLTGKKLEE